MGQSLGGVPLGQQTSRLGHLGRLGPPGHLGQLGQLAKSIGQHLTPLRIRLGWAVRMLRPGHGLKASPASILPVRLWMFPYVGGRDL